MIPQWRQLWQIARDRAFVHGARSRRGWGQVVRDDIAPLLDHPKLRDHADILDETMSRVREPVSVFIVGEGNFGKSTLINALVGSEVAKMHFLPTTWHITRYVPLGETPCSELHYDRSVEQASPFEALCRRHSVQPDCEAGVVHLQDLDALERLLAEEEMRIRGLDASSALWRAVVSVDIPLAGGFSMDLVDTPGISQTRKTGSVQDSIEQFYHRADVVLWLLVADRLNAKEGRAALSSLARYGKPIVGVVNRADQIPAGRREEIRSKAERVFGESVAQVHLVSAKSGLDARRNSDPGALEASGVEALERSIVELGGHRGSLTKALSVFNTAASAAADAAAILRQEADVFEENIDTFERNQATAAGFRETALARVRQEVPGAAGSIQAAGARCMRSTARLNSSSSSVINEEAVRRELRSASRRCASDIGRVVSGALLSCQDRIAARPYEEQTYDMDASVKSHDYRTSVNVDTAGVAADVRLEKFEPEFSWGALLGGLVEGAIDFVANLFGGGMSESEKLRRQRERELEAYIAGLPKVVADCQSQIRKALEAAIERAQGALRSEVKTCFEDQFGTVTRVRASVRDFRARANRARLPRPLVHAANAALRAGLANRDRSPRRVDPKRAGVPRDGRTLDEEVVEQEAAPGDLVTAWTSPLIMSALTGGVGTHTGPGVGAASSLFIGTSEGSAAVPPWATVSPRQIEEAEGRGVPVAFENDLGMRFILIPAGEFWMGSPDAEEGRREDETRHKVRVSEPYYLQVTQVTNGQYKKKEARHRSEFEGPEQPVDTVSWSDASQFAQWCSSRDGERGYVLPSEAQWEHACRAGTTTPFAFGETISTEQANHDGRHTYGEGCRGVYRGKTLAVGALSPNGWGLHEMHGNVWEWCLDAYNAYPSSPMTVDPTGLSFGENRVMRGGSWGNYPSFIRSASRRGYFSGTRIGFGGFRLLVPLRS